MHTLTTEEIRHIVKGRWRWPGSGTVSGVSTDSRAPGRGRMFIALRGAKFDGSRFLPDAASAGCTAALVRQDAVIEQAVLERFPGGVIGVNDTLSALGDLARDVRGRMTATVVAVTGSNGKTTVKRMIHHILARRLKGSASPKSFNNNIGVPLTLLAVAPDDEYVVCELGSNALGEIGALTAIARPDIAVITSIGEVHLEGLIDLEHVAAEKASILDALPEAGLGVVWADSPELERAARQYSARLVRFGRGEQADLRLTGYEPRLGGGRFELNGRAWFELPIPGPHMAQNALAAVAVAQRFGFSQDEAAGALADFVGEDMRLQEIKAGGLTIINDAYNANPASMRAAGESLASYAGRRVLVAGDMLELEPRSVELHNSTGQALARAGVDLVVGVGRLGQYIAAGARAAGGEALAIATVEEACRSVPALLRAGDVVLVKGSRGAAMERLIEPLRAAVP